MCYYKSNVYLHQLHEGGKNKTKLLSLSFKIFLSHDPSLRLKWLTDLFERLLLGELKMDCTENLTKPNTITYSLDTVDEMNENVKI